MTPLLLRLNGGKPQRSSSRLICWTIAGVEMKSASGLHYLIWVDEVSYDQLTFSKLHFLQMVSELTASMVDKAGYYQVFSSMNKDSGLTTHSSPGEMRQGN